MCHRLMHSKKISLSCHLSLSLSLPLFHVNNPHINIKLFLLLKQFNNNIWNATGMKWWVFIQTSLLYILCLMFISFKHLTGHLSFQAWVYETQTSQRRHSAIYCHRRRTLVCSSWRWRSFHPAKVQRVNLTWHSVIFINQF